MRFLRKFISSYLSDYPAKLSYMLQQSEYELSSFLRWWGRTRDFRYLEVRGTLVPSRNAKLIRLTIRGAVLAYWIVNMLMIYLLRHDPVVALVGAVLIVVLYPIVVVIITSIVISALKLLAIPLRNRKLVNGERTFAAHNGIVIAVLGSYGKTTMKDVMLHIFGPSAIGQDGNKNTLQSIARFGAKLRGDEEVVIVEFGEGAPGDIRRMTELVQPDYVVVTGMAPNHLDKYKTLAALCQDIKEATDYVGADRTFYNGDNEQLVELLKGRGNPYSRAGFADWSVSGVHLRVDGTSFVLGQAGHKVAIDTGLLGRHNVPVVAFAVGLATQLGQNIGDIEQRAKSLKPHEHRMQPRDLGGMWMIDDTYNGNIEGMKAGLNLLSELKVDGRKLYATPGLVDQGPLTEEVHSTLGKAIAAAKPDHVYLMKNSVTDIIKRSLDKEGYAGKLTLIDNPLVFYTHISDTLAAGDVILCQNDWPDNYS